MQILPPKNTFGSRVSDILGTGLQDLAEAKVKQLRDQYQENATEKALLGMNIPKEKASALAKFLRHAPEKAQSLIMDQLSPALADMFLNPQQQAQQQGQPQQFGQTQQQEPNRLEQLLDQSYQQPQSFMNPYATLQNVGFGGMRPELMSRAKQPNQGQQQPVQMSNAFPAKQQLGRQISPKRYLTRQEIMKLSAVTKPVAKAAHKTDYTDLDRRIKNSVSEDNPMKSELSELGQFLYDKYTAKGIEPRKATGLAARAVIKVGKLVEKAKDLKPASKEIQKILVDLSDGDMATAEAMWKEFKPA